MGVCNMKIESTVSMPSVKATENGNIEGNNQKLSISKIREATNSKEKTETAKDLSENILNKAMEQANSQLNTMNRSIERHVHEKTKTVMYKIIDIETKEVIREFPPEKIQDMIAKMWELAGLFVDEKA